MSLYEGLKDAAKVVQKADNIELYQKLLDLSAQALDMQEQIAALTAENTDLKRKKDISERIERHKEPYITLNDDNLNLVYCSHCWDIDNRLVQAIIDEDDGTFVCPHCKIHGIYDSNLHRRYYKEMKEAEDNQIASYLSF